MNAGFGRRAAALLYDGLIVVAMWLLYTAVALFVTQGRAITFEDAGGWVYLYRAGLVALVLIYYTVSVHRTGHTLGMRAWRLRVQMPGGALVSVRRALWRCALGMLAWSAAALGVLWLYVDHEGLALHDRVSRTRVLTLR